MDGLRSELNFVIELYLVESADHDDVKEAPTLPPSKLKVRLRSVSRQLNQAIAFLTTPPSNFLSYFDDGAVRLARRGHKTPDFPVRETPFAPEKATLEWPGVMSVLAVSQLDFTLERLRWLVEALNEAAVSCEEVVEKGWARKGSDLETLYDGLVTVFGKLKGISIREPGDLRPPYHDPSSDRYVGEVLDFVEAALTPIPEGEKSRDAIAQLIRWHAFNIRK
jgi:hypothetical protein